MENEITQYKTFKLRQLFGRITGILINSKKEWNKIANEKPAIAGLIFKYALILALIPPIIIVLYSSLFNYDNLFFKLTGWYWGINMAISNFLSTIITIYFTSILMNELAIMFNSEKNLGRATQTIVYSLTPYWIFSFIYRLPGAYEYFIIPSVAYSVWILYRGLPFTMKTPEKKRLLYVIVTFATTIIIASLLYLISRLVLNYFGNDPLSAI